MKLPAINFWSCTLNEKNCIINKNLEEKSKQKKEGSFWQKDTSSECWKLKIYDIVNHEIHHTIINGVILFVQVCPEFHVLMFVVMLF